LKDGYVGNVSVALHTDLSKLYAPKIAQFVRAHPKLDVTILTRSSREILDLVENGEIDIGIGFFKTLPRSIRRKKSRKRLFPWYFRAATACSGATADTCGNRPI